MPTIYINAHTEDVLNRVKDHMVKEFSAVWKRREEISIDTAVLFLYNAWSK